MIRNFLYVHPGAKQPLTATFMSTRNGHVMRHFSCSEHEVHLPVGADLFVLAVPDEHQDLLLVAARLSDYVLSARTQIPPATILPESLQKFGYRFAGDGYFAFRAGDTQVSVYSGQYRIDVPIKVVPASPADIC